MRQTSWKDWDGTHHQWTVEQESAHHQQESGPQELSSCPVWSGYLWELFESTLRVVDLMDVNLISAGTLSPTNWGGKKSSLNKQLLKSCYMKKLSPKSNIPFKENKY